MCYNLAWKFFNIEVDAIPMGKHVTKYMLYQKERKMLPVDENVHRLVVLYAKEHKITITEATYILLGKALKDAWICEEEE